MTTMMTTVHHRCLRLYCVHSRQARYILFDIVLIVRGELNNCEYRKIEQATIDLIVEEDEELTFEAIGKK